ncbi:DNA-binding response OmpR family regulator [Haloferula luteola]|uniref:DNA-binding response OmpR family regulator n=1 Tax=Haloferula luteola TaxID=595692 RepID=A0A840V3P5_9BACT|nr:response regulator transcription factor [Haloferula luteola]MBB5352143.1 DNA-binding response OmpR family regulator [Haloferula luteola]
MKVLLAEDDAVTREAVTRLLEDEGFRVVSSQHGGEAWEAWMSEGAELVLLDIMMPELSGYEVCRRIRQVDRQVPVVFLSAKSEEIDVVLGLELGADEFIRKPFGGRELLARVNAVLRRTRSGATESFEVGPWRVFPKSLRAEGPHAVELSLREVKLLQLLYSRRGEVVSRDEILNVCWGLEYYPESRTLDQHVLNLRKKLEPEPAHPQWLLTVRGAGYRMP